jgi:hypothetical protein
MRKVMVYLRTKLYIDKFNYLLAIHIKRKLRINSVEPLFCCFTCNLHFFDDPVPYIISEFWIKLSNFLFHAFLRSYAVWKTRSASKNSSSQKH